MRKMVQKFKTLKGSKLDFMKRYLAGDLTKVKE